MIRAENIEKSFGEIAVLDGVNAEIARGEIVGLCGASGTGKSTFAKILCGLIKPDGGNVYFDGEPLFGAKGKYDRTRGLHIQIVFQQPQAVLDPSQKIRTGLEEIALYHRLSGRKNLRDFIDKIVGEVELERDILGHFPHQISGGEAQRIALAKCLMFNPELLILDEATSMLDATTQANLLALVRRITKKQCGSVLLITHDRELADFYCDRVCVLKDRKIHDVEN